MNSNASFSVDRDDRLAEALDAYLAAQEAGTPPDVEEFLARYPELAGELRECLASLAFIRRAGNLSVAGDAPSEVESSGGVLGDFRIVREVGRGGMGVVYEAEQISLRRRVALKVLPFAATMDSRHLQRFHNEAQAAACLHHTNIVPVHFVGSVRGVHFYAMQFIDGQPLSEIIRQLCRLEKNEQSADGEPTIAYESLSGGDAASTPPAAAITPLSNEGRRSRAYFRKVAELGVQAAEALDYAHQLGIVHRDIKPGNLMLDERGIVWVMDFGLAHVQHSEASLTLTGQAVGTPRYMSPEQALAKRVPIDHRTDVYSLGVTLYEMLTLRPAFESDDREELLRQIAFEEPTRPRRLERGIPAELEIIVLKAMEKRPQDRYATAQELADDLRRWLLDHPIRARRPSLLQRADKWRRRHRVFVTAAASVVILATLAFAVSTALIAGAYDAEAKQRQEMERQRDLAREQGAEARRAVNDMYTEVAEQWMAQQPRLQQTQQKFLEKALRYYEHFAQEQNTEPAIRLEAAQAYRRVGQIHQKLRHHKQAEDSYIEAISIIQDLVNNAPAEPTYRSELAVAYTGLGTLRKETGRFAEAEQAFGQALELRKALAADFPGDPQYQWLLGNAWNKLGNLLSDTGRPAEAEDAYRQGLALLRPVATSAPQVAHYRVDLAALSQNLGNLLRQTGRARQAEDAFRSALAWHEKLAAEFPTRPDYRRSLADLHVCLGALWDDTGRLADAEKADREALAIYETLVRDFPSVPDYRMSLAACSNNLAEVLRKTPRTKEAENAYHQAVTLLEKLTSDFPDVPQYHWQRAACRANLANLLSDKGQLREAVQLYREARDAIAKLARQHPNVPNYRSVEARSHHNLGNALVAASQWAEAVSAFNQGIALQEKLAGEFPTVPLYRERLAMYLLSRAQLLPKTGRAKEARTSFLQAIDLYERLATEFPTESNYRFDLGSARQALAIFLEGWGRTTEAEHVFREAQLILEKLIADFPNIPSYREYLGRLRRDRSEMFLRAGRLQDAEQDQLCAQELFRALAAELPTVPAYKEDLAGSYLNSGNRWNESGQLEKAEEAYRQALTIQRKLVEDFPANSNYRVNLSIVRYQQATLLLARGRLKEAQKQFRETCSLLESVARELPTVPEYRIKAGGAYTSLGMAFARDGRFAEAIAAYDRARTLAPDQYFGYSFLAWFLSTCPDPKLRDPHRARELARKAVQLAPEEYSCWRALGAAYYRNGDWKAAIQALAKARKRSAGGYSEGWFFQAMTLWQQGDRQQARRWYDAAVRWMQQSELQNNEEELRRLRAEAAALLGVKEPIAERASETRRADLDSQRTRANAANDKAAVLKENGRLQEAEASWRQALAVYERLAADFAVVPEFRWLIAVAQHNLAILLKQTGRLEDAETAVRRSETFFAQLAADFPDEAGYRQERASNLNTLGNLLGDKGRVKEAATIYGRAISMQEKLIAEAPNSADYREELARSCNGLAGTQQQLGEPEAAEANYRRALALYKKLAVESPETAGYRAEVARTQSNLGALLADTERLQDAEKAYQSALALYEKLATAYPGVPEYRAEAARVCMGRGDLWAKDGRAPQAERAYDQALATAKKLVADLPTMPYYRDFLRKCYQRKANLQANAGRFPEAEQSSRQALAISEKLVKELPTIQDYQARLAECRNALAWLLATDPDPRRRDSKQAVALAQQSVGAYPGIGGFWNTLGAAQYRNGDWKDALVSLAKSVELSRGGSSIDFFLMAMTHWQLDHKDEARDCYAQAVQLMDKRKPQDEALRRFRAEAAALLNIKETKKESKAGR